VNGIPDELGTAVTVMSMVFGNMGEDSGTGVAFTRNPSTGEPKFFGEFLVNAQGEDVVAGIRDPLPIDLMSERLPAAHAALLEAAQRAGGHYREMQDLEFTVERGRLYMLQTRTGKRSAAAAVRIAVEMVDEGLLSPTRRCCGRPGAARPAAAPDDRPAAEVECWPPACRPRRARRRAGGLQPGGGGRSAGQAGEAVILVRRETSPEDFEGMVAARRSSPRAAG
jgi:pyruvate, orthophosphate dikinase